MAGLDWLRLHYEQPVKAYGHAVGVGVHHFAFQFDQRSIAVLDAMFQKIECHFNLDPGSFHKGGQGAKEGAARGDVLGFQFLNLPWLMGCGRINFYLCRKLKVESFEYSAFLHGFLDQFHKNLDYNGYGVFLNVRTRNRKRQSAVCIIFGDYFFWAENNAIALVPLLRAGR